MATFKDRLHGTQDRMTAHLCAIASPAVTQALAAAGADAVIVDLEHGAIGYDAAHAMIAAVGGRSCCPMVRVAEVDEALVKRSLDLGAEGIVFPLIRTAADAARAVASLRYPPRGTRGFGPFLAHAHFDVPLMAYRDQVEDRLICCLLVETAEAVANIDEICQVEGIDLIIPAQFDLSTNLGLQGQFDHPDFLAALDRVETAVKAAGIPLGGVALAEPQAKALLDRGYRVITGVDALWLATATRTTQSWLA